MKGKEEVGVMKEGRIILSLFIIALVIGTSLALMQVEARKIERICELYNEGCEYESGYYYCLDWSYTTGYKTDSNSFIVNEDFMHKKCGEQP